MRRVWTALDPKNTKDRYVFLPLIICRDFYLRLSLIITTSTIFLSTTIPLTRIIILTNPHAYIHCIRDNDKDKDRSILSIAYIGAVTCISSRYLVTRTSCWCVMFFFWMSLWCACFSYGALDFLLDLMLFGCSKVIVHPFICIVLEFSISLVRIHAFISHLSKHAHTLAWFRRSSQWFFYVLLFSHSLLSSFPRMLSFAKLKCFSKTFQSRYSRLLTLWLLWSWPLSGLHTLAGQNFRFVLGGLSRCYNVPFPS